MITVNRVAEKNVAFLKGAPEVAVLLCDHILINGEPRPLTDTNRQAYLSAYEELAQRGERVLLFAYQPLAELTAWNLADLPQGGYIFIGLAGLIDPPRPEVPDAVAALRHAGVRVVMVTGDYQTTAVAVGRMVGIVTGDAAVVITARRQISSSSMTILPPCSPPSTKGAPFSKT